MSRVETCSVGCSDVEGWDGGSSSEAPLAASANNQSVKLWSVPLQSRCSGKELIK